MSQAGIINLSSQSGVVDSVTGSNGVTASPTTGDVIVSGVNATTTTVGVASFNSANFTVNGSGQVTISAVSVAEGGTGDATLTDHSILIGRGTSPVEFAGPSATAGQILQSAGLLANPGFSTATYPSTVTINRLIYASSNDVLTGLASQTNGTLVTSNTGVPSILAGPGTTGNILQSNAAAAPSFSTATYPSVATGTGTILRANGTNWVATTATYPTTTTANQLLVSTAASVIGEVTAGTTGTVLTGVNGAVPAFSATPTVTSITFGAGSALNTFVQGTFVPTIRGSVTAGTIAYGTQEGRYQKVGRVVTISIVVSWTTIGTAAGAVQCDNLPFTVINSGGASTAGSLVNSFAGVLVTAAGAVPFMSGNANAATANINYYLGATGANNASVITASNQFSVQYVYETT